MTPAEKTEPIPFGKYRLLDRLSIGESFEVWRATQPAVGGYRPSLAIKRALPHLARDETFASWFLQEARLTVRLSHPNIAQVFDVGSIDETYYLAMEYVSGLPLARLIKRYRDHGPVPIPLACEVVAQCCDGLEHAHSLRGDTGSELGIVHRQVSPQNVLISYDGEVKLIEWTGRAPPSEEPSRQSMTNMIRHLSPEQVRGHKLDRRSDIFQLGICLHELLTGRRPFVGDSDYAVLKAVMDAAVEPPTKHDPAFPLELEKVVLKALAKKPEDRYPTARELGDALRPFSTPREDLSRFMKTAFAKDHERERQRLLEVPLFAPPGSSPRQADGVLDLVKQLEREWDV